MATKLDVIPPLEEWDINLVVSSQVYQLLKGFKQLEMRLCGLTICPYRTWEGFRIEFEKTFSQVVIAPYSLQKQLTSDQRIMSITTPHSTSQVSLEVETY